MLKIYIGRKALNLQHRGSLNRFGSSLCRQASAAAAKAPRPSATCSHHAQTGPLPPAQRRCRQTGQALPGAAASITAPGSACTHFTHCRRQSPGPALVVSGLERPVLAAPACTSALLRSLPPELEHFVLAAAGHAGSVGAPVHAEHLVCAHAGGCRVAHVNEQRGSGQSRGS